MSNPIMRKRLVCSIFLLFSLFCHAQQIKKVKAEYIYYGAETLSLEQAKSIALERAKIQVIADEFGTIVSQTNYTNVSNDNSYSSVDFKSIGMTDLRGEWIETLKEPVFNISYTEGMQIIKVVVIGKIRKIDHAQTQISATLLRNGTDRRFESSEFRNNDDLFLHFISPVNGYLTIYLIDNKDTAYCLLPYARQTEGTFMIEANKEYVLFDRSLSTLDDKTMVDEYIMTCGTEKELNRLAIIFSENYFVKSSDIGISEGLPRQLDITSFNNWVAKSRVRDVRMQYQEIPFIIKP